MILRRLERQDCVPVDDREDARLLPHQAFFNHDPFACIAKRQVDHRVANGGNRVLTIVADGHAFACGQAVRLDDQRSFAAFVDVSNGGGRIVEHGIVGRRHIRQPHHLLGVGLARFKCGRSPRGSEDAARRLLESRRPCPATSGASGPMTARSICSALQNFKRRGVSVARMSRFTVLGSSAVPAFPGAEDTCHRGRLSQLPGQHVLPASVADDQYFHQLKSRAVFKQERTIALQSRRSERPLGLKKYIGLCREPSRTWRCRLQRRPGSRHSPGYPSGVSATLNSASLCHQTCD